MKKPRDGNTYDVLEADWADYPMLNVKYKSTSYNGSTSTIATQMSMVQFIGKFSKYQLPKLPEGIVQAGSDAFSLD